MCANDLPEAITCPKTPRDQNGDLIASGGEAFGLAMQLAAAPLALAGVGILCSIAGIFSVKAKEGANAALLTNSKA